MDFALSERAGATRDDMLVNMAMGMSSIASTLSRREKASEDGLAAASAKGTLNSLRLREENLAFLARPRNRFEVQLCQGAVERGFYTWLKKLGQVGRDKLQKVK